MGFNPIEWLGDRIEDLYMGLKTSPELILARETARGIFKAYQLRDDDEAFRELWFLLMRATVTMRQTHDDAVEEVLRSIDTLKTLVDRAPAEPTRFGSPITLVADDGLLTVQSASASGRYVIFSDHHMLPNGARQNFFRFNRDLYVDVLRDYYGAEDYCLVENGDVEELLIYEPELGEVEGIGGWDWDQIIAFRNVKKRIQLGEIVRDNRDYYETVAEHFIAKEKYFRITGNHDRDMRQESFAGLVSATAGIDFPVASDVLLLRGARSVDFVVCHGHQFDTGCTPKYAAQTGESFSQATAWAVQGPDRNWRTALDPIGKWLSGDEVLYNQLVSDEPNEGLSPLETSLGDVGATVQQLLDGLGGLIGTLDTRRGWEALYGKNIGWEYFDNADSPSKAFREEVKPGFRWFKFRHMNEFRLVDRLELAFGNRIPTLILGHSHEPRIRPGVNWPGVERRQIDFYLNSGAAGRFENLIWGIELIDGEPFLISWHRETRSGGPVAVRTIWEDSYTGSKYIIEPVSSATLQELLSGKSDEEEDSRNLALMIASEHAL